MNQPIPLNWPSLVVIVLCLCTCTWVWGRSRMTDYQDNRIEWVVGDYGRLRTVVRMLYEATGYEWPEDAEAPEPERKPSRWQRLRDWKMHREPVGLLRWQFVPTTSEPKPEPAVDDLDEPDLEAPPEVPGPRTNPIGIPTQPDMKKASAVAPPADIDAIYEQAMAAIRGDKT